MTDALARIAAALERLAPAHATEVDPASGERFRWDGARLHDAGAGDILPLARFAGVDGQIAALSRNARALAAGAPAHDMLLWGARGMGKSALVRAIAADCGVALVQAGGDALSTLPDLFRLLARAGRPFIVFVDDLAFEAADPTVRLLRSLLDGGIAERPANVRLAVTSNHRHLIAGSGMQQDGARHARDAADDQLALVDRFGLVLGFHVPDQDSYLEMVRRHAEAEGLSFEPEDAIAFALARGGRSGRTAWHYRTELLTRRAAAD
ncbi:DUF815 domain-containing protein [Sandaracinobacteroides sp. A072]|uniref:DUF815 domain-containing protein n=1 Tax=Sandaracinobacteroides sp. A072 TaxID=3461146 RepID=UPI004042FADE